jgi:hypothetical protein
MKVLRGGIHVIWENWSAISNLGGYELILMKDTLGELKRHLSASLFVVII